jgi:hypothetical protein
LKTCGWEVLATFARWAAAGRLAVPIARTFALDEWDLAREISLSGQARGNLVLLPGGEERRETRVKTTWKYGTGSNSAARASSHRAAAVPRQVGQWRLQEEL